MEKTVCTASDRIEANTAINNGTFIEWVHAHGMYTPELHRMYDHWRTLLRTYTNLEYTLSMETPSRQK